MVVDQVYIPVLRGASVVVLRVWRLDWRQRDNTKAANVDKQRLDWTNPSVAATSRIRCLGNGSLGHHYM